MTRPKEHSPAAVARWPVAQREAYIAGKNAQVQAMLAVVLAAIDWSVHPEAYAAQLMLAVAEYRLPKKVRDE